MNQKILLFLLIFFKLSPVTSAYGTKITVYALDAMPYCGIVNGEIQGIAIDVLNEATKIGAPEFTFRFDIPWQRAQLMINDQNNNLSAIIPFSYSEQRKDNYTWISLLCSRHFKIYSLTKKIDTLNEAKDYSIGIVRGHVLIKVMQDLRFSKIYHGAENAKVNLKMLELGRVDAVADSDLIVLYNWSKINNKKLKLYEGPEIGNANYIYIASGLNFPSDVAKQIDDALKIMRDNGKIEEIIQKWIE